MTLIDDEPLFERQFLGECFGIALRRRSVSDPHVVFVILVEDDGYWGKSKSDGGSSVWLQDLQDALTDAISWVRANCPPDPSGFGYVFPQPVSTDGQNDARNFQGVRSDSAIRARLLTSDAMTQCTCFHRCEREAEQGSYCGQCLKGWHSTHCDEYSDNPRLGRPVADLAPGLCTICGAREDEHDGQA